MAKKSKSGEESVVTSPDPEADALALDAMASLFGGDTPELSLGTVPGIVTTEAVEENLPYTHDEDMSALQLDDIKETFQANFDLLHTALEELKGDNSKASFDHLAQSNAAVQKLLATIEGQNGKILETLDAMKKILGDLVTSGGAAAPAKADSVESDKAPASKSTAKSDKAADKKISIPEATARKLVAIDPTDYKKGRLVPLMEFCNRLSGWLGTPQGGGVSYPADEIAILMRHAKRVDQDGNVIALKALQ